MKPAARPLRCFLAAATLAASLLLATPARAATIATLLDECDAAWLGLARESGGGGEALSWTRFQIVETLAGPPPAGETPTALLAYDRRISHQPRPEPGRTYLLFTRGIGRPADPAAPAPDGDWRASRSGEQGMLPVSGPADPLAVAARRTVAARAVADPGARAAALKNLHVDLIAGAPDAVALSAACDLARDESAKALLAAADFERLLVRFRASPADSRLRHEMIELFGDRRCDAAVDALIESLAEPRAARHLPAIARALRRTARPDTGQLLARALRRGEPAAKRSAARLAGDLRLADAAPALIECLRAGDDHALRRAAAAALGDIGSRAAVPDLLRLLDDPDAETRAAAAYALPRAGGAAGQRMVDAFRARLPEGDPLRARIDAWTRDPAKRLD